MIFIAELCQNHSGNIEDLYKLMDDAVEAGATHLKIQTIFAEDLSMRKEFEKPSHFNKENIYIKQRPYKLEYERLKTLELDYKSHELFLNRCSKLKVDGITTLFNFKHLKAIKKIGFKAIKIASYDCGSQSLIKAVSENFDEIFISTGASFEYEIKKAIEILNESKKKFHVMHCCTIYPTPVSALNLAKMSELGRIVPSFGLSNHSLPNNEGIFSDFVSIYLGAKLIERHFTSFCSNKTKDGPISITNDGLKKIINFSRLSKSDQLNIINQNSLLFEKIVGNKEVCLSNEELSNRAYYRGRFINKLGNKEYFNWEWDLEKEMKGICT